MSVFKGMAVSVLVAVGLGALAEAPPVLTLKEAVSLALQNSPSVEAAGQRLSAAEAAIQEARSGFLPQLSVHETYTRTQYPPLAFSLVLARRDLVFDSSVDFNDPEREDNFNTELRLRYPLYQGGQTTAQHRAAAAGQRAASAELDEVRNELIFRVVEAYFLILQAQDMLGVQEETVRLVETQLELVRARYEAGAVVQSDLLNVEVRLAEERQNLIVARNRLDLAYAALFSVLGVEHLEQTPLLDQSCHLEPVTLSMSELIERARGERPALSVLAHRLASLESQVRAAQADYYPRANVFGSYYLDSERLEDAEDAWAVGVSADWTLFDGWRTSARVKQARARLAETEALQRNLSQAVELEVRQSYLRAQEASDRLPIAAKSVAQAEESERIVRSRYESGSALVTELLDAELAYRRARIAEVNARYDYQIALAALRRAQGALLQEYSRRESAND